MGIRETIIELKESHRDFIINHVWEDISRRLIEKLKKGKRDQNQKIHVKLNEHELDKLIGGLTIECNYNEEVKVRNEAHKIKGVLKGYRYRLDV